MSVWGVVFWLVAATGLAALCGSFLGGLHPAGDSLAVFRSHIAGAGALWVLIGWATGMTSPAWLVLLAVAVTPAAMGYTRYEFVSAAPNTTIYQKNMRYRNPDISELTADIREIAPDILTLQEMTVDHTKILQELKDILPYSHHCDYGPVGTAAVASRWPTIDGSKLCVDGFTAMRVDAPEGPLWVGSVHLHWPWPERQRVMVDDLVPVMQGLDGPAIVGGDFNMVPWSSTLRRIATALGAERAGRVRMSFPLNHPKGLPLEQIAQLPIDHVLIPAGKRGASELRPKLGSDHRGLVVRF
ncbi:endonuclease/exonuclease/phosphatase family protein [Tropicimonas marinistellae]|uniref:endonuclease/exonuclease/phosphatase family protein n=1 Tax=Tropicimonas marinistellae TaxID=1739787 RepID=UPI00082B4D4D|nr:endonuclease/exonuclease/phosphatase family protein [Tropicimonas marinistellae]